MAEEFSSSSSSPNSHQQVEQGLITDERVRQITYGPSKIAQNCNSTSEQCELDMPAHLHCWFTVWNRGRGRRCDLNTSYMPDAIHGTASVTHGTSFRLASDRGARLKGLNAASALDAISIRVLKASFRPDKAEDALSGTEEDAVASLMVVFPAISISGSARDVGTM
ncbi:hypothetical protein Taro_053583 [Colocasia esculenta]|uniref:Uncharacterized protein n=1 Tax=Colocasia esculenta TaxID=4460 RepID=A0A843XN88_COLES|nr:hypothetical protein [Colocasia esculenta]